MHFTWTHRLNSFSQPAGTPILIYARCNIHPKTVGDPALNPQQALASECISRKYLQLTLPYPYHVPPDSFKELHALKNPDLVSSTRKLCSYRHQCTDFDIASTWPRADKQTTTSLSLLKRPRSVGRSVGRCKLIKSFGQGQGQEQICLSARYSNQRERFMGLFSRHSLFTSDFAYFDGCCRS